MRIALVVFAVLFLAATAQAERWPYVDQLNSQSYQLYVREWGRLSAICSAGAYWTDGKVTRLLTAGHCIALSQDMMGRSVEFLVTQTGSSFFSARVLSSGWKLREPNPTSRSVDIAKIFSRLPSPGSLLPLATPDRIDISGGDWAILEVEGARPAAAPGDSTTLKEDDAVFMYGYPLGGDRFFARGYIANVRYRAPGTEWAEGYIAADITAAPGNSGSLVVDEQDRAVAILVAGAGDRLHILTPISIVRKAIPCFAEAACDKLSP